MSKKVVRFLFKKRAGTTNGSNHVVSLNQQKKLAQKLVYSLNPTRIPSLLQLKYLSQVLPSTDRRIVVGLLGVVLLSLAAIGVIFYSRNVIMVPAVGGEFTTSLIGAPQFINPLLSQINDVDTDISRLIFSGLLRYNHELQLIPDLAAVWESNESQTEYTFTIKQGITWHDGQPLTADDVVFTFQSIKDPDFKSPLLISFRGVEVQKLDSHTVRFVLPQAYPSFLEVLTVGIVPEHIWGDVPPINANLTEYNIKPIGSGPWQFKSLTKDRLGNIKSYTLTPYQNFYGPKPYLEQITFKFYPDFATAVAALKNKSVEGISFLPKDLKSEITGEKNLKQYSFYLPQYTAVFFNQKKNELLKEKTIRRALGLGINKPDILTQALQLEGEIIDGPILPVSIDISDDKKLTFNPDQANQLLDEASWERISPETYQEFLKAQAEAESNDAEQAEQTEEQTQEDTESVSTSTQNVDELASAPASGQSFYRKKGDAILALTLTTVSQPENTKAAELIKQSWENLGISVQLQIVEGSRISREVIKPRNYEVLLFGIIVGSNPDPYPFWHSSQVQDPGLNLALFANREVDALLEEARKTADPIKQQGHYQRFQEILNAEIPAIFLYNPTYTYVTDQKIKGLDIERIIVPADRFNNLQDWYIKTKKQLRSEFN